MSYSHLSIIERGQLETLHRLGWSCRRIGRELGRQPSTIARELSRGRKPGEAYTACTAQQTHQERRTRSVPAGKYTESLAEEIDLKLQETWSPEQIAQRRRVEGKPPVCFKTIYRLLYQGRVASGKVQVLRQKGKRRKPVETRGRFLIGTPISKRPKEVRQRTTFGHWELDTVVSSRGKSKACVATFIERKTRHYLALKMPDRTAHSMEVAVGVVATGGLLREFFPKDHDFASVTDEQLAEAIHLINNRPRKCLGWKSAREAFMEELSHLA